MVGGERSGGARRADAGAAAYFARKDLRRTTLRPLRPRRPAALGGPGVIALEVDPDERRQRYQHDWAEGGFQLLFGGYYDLGSDEEANRTVADFVRDKIASAVKDLATREKLLPQVGGFNCIQCHAVGDKKAVAPFEAEGINLLDAAQRLRYEYFARWMLDPTRVEATTRMTKFTMDGKTTALTDVLDGDARRQFDAIWHYMQTLPEKTRK